MKNEEIFNYEEQKLKDVIELINKQIKYNEKLFNEQKMVLSVVKN